MQDWAAVLEVEDRRSVLIAYSGLPGPRANLPLAKAYARTAPVPEAAAFAQDSEEYLALCGAMALGLHADEHEAGARRAAADPRWRVREGVATGLQQLGARDPEAMLGVLATWRDDPDPLVARARAAAICEPPLLKTAPLRAAALAVCVDATALLRDLPDRRSDDARVLRQALGYCWSVAVAAEPSAGLPAFRALEPTGDADIAWIVRSNRTKARLARLL